MADSNPRKRSASPIEDAQAAKSARLADSSSQDDVEKQLIEYDNLAVSQRNQRESPLLRLPAELRNAIYLWAFSGQPMFVRAITYYGVSTRSLAMGTYHSISILLACRQMHAEAESLLYKYSCFNVCFIFESVSRFALKRTPVQLDAITSLKPSILWYYQPRLSQCELAADVSGAFRFLHKLSGLRHLHIEIEFLNTNVNKEQRWGISR